MLPENEPWGMGRRLKCGERQYVARKPLTSFLYWEMGGREGEDECVCACIPSTGSNVHTDLLLHLAGGLLN